MLTTQVEITGLELRPRLSNSKICYTTEKYKVFPEHTDIWIKLHM